MNVFTLVEPRVAQSRQVGENQVDQCPPTVVESTSKKAREASTDEISTITEQPVNLVVQEVQCHIRCQSRSGSTVGSSVVIVFLYATNSMNTDPRNP